MKPLAGHRAAPSLRAEVLGVPGRRGVLRALAGLGLLAAGLGVSARAVAVAHPVASAEPLRCALLVGNARYPGAELRNPVNDARLIGASARSLGFRTRIAENTDRSALIAALDDFLLAAREAEVRLFYFAGHGVRAQGMHYLLPAGVRVRNEDQLPAEALDTDSIVDRMNALPPGVNLLIFDACRASLAVAARHARGLAPMRDGLRDLVARPAPQGTLIVYSTGPQQLASDGPGDANGPFARHLAAEMLRVGVPVETMLKRVRMAVMAETHNRQIPWEASSLAGELSLAADFDWRTRHTGGRP